MQKRSNRPGMVLFQPIQFVEDLPVVLNPHIDPDHPSTTLHYHDAVEVSLCTHGRGIFFVEENVFPYREGTLIQVAPNALHIAQSEEGQNPRWVTLYLDIQFMGSTLSSQSLPLNDLLGSQVLDTVNRPRLAAAVKGLSSEYFRNDSFFRLGLIGHLQILLVELLRSQNTGQLLATGQNPDIERIAPALNYIAANLDQPLPLILLAKYSGMSESNFRRAFLKAMGRSPHQYILDSRIQFAKSLLHDRSISILEVSQRCGFETLSTYNRAFKKRTGVSPREWRNAGD